MPTAAQRIQELMNTRDMSQADVAKLADIDPSSMSNVLSGRRKVPSSGTLTKIAKALGVSVDYLTGVSDDPTSSDAPPLPAFALEVLESMRHLDKTRNYELSVIARSFVEASGQINQMTRQEFMSMIQNAAEEIHAGNEEELNQLVIILQSLERRWQTLPPPNNGANQPGEGNA